ncbi:hypothetical protein Efla_005044 [Eimeria flavescens]
MACDLGVYGLAVMGVNLALNAASKGFKVCVSNRTPSRVDHAADLAKQQGLQDNIVGVKDIKEFVENIKKPRRIIMLVQARLPLCLPPSAGAPVDALMQLLLPLLSKGDVLVDGGNEFYTATERRIETCNQHGVLFLGMGVSGGEEGARAGPSMMPGGVEEAWKRMRSILLPIAGQIDAKKAAKGGKEDFSKEEVDNSCVAYLGPGGCGNFVKMVHNGIEYGDMQIIAEAYSVLRHCYDMGNEELSDLFRQWNKTELESYLIEITSHILRKKEGDKYLLDMVLDTAGSKGTGKWTVQEAAEWGVPIPCLSAALDMRYISAHRGLRDRLSSLYAAAFEKKEKCNCEGAPTFDDMKSAMYVAKICCYAQGMHLIATASRQKKWGLSLAEVSRIWKGGCIIRAKFLEVMQKAFQENPEVEQLLLIDSIRNDVARHLPGLRRVLELATCKRPVVHEGASALLLSLPAMSAAYHYVSAFTSAHLPTNLVQAQRDLFGAHTFERTDNPGHPVHEPNWMADACMHAGRQCGSQKNEKRERPLELFFFAVFRGGPQRLFLFRRL